MDKENCKLVNNLIVPCPALAKVTTDYNGHYKKGMSIMPITRIQEKENGGADFVHAKDLLLVKNGEYEKTGIICNYCPFCGESVYERKQETQNVQLN